MTFLIVSLAHFVAVIPTDAFDVAVKPSEPVTVATSVSVPLEDAEPSNLIVLPNVTDPEAVLVPDFQYTSDVVNGPGNAGTP